MGISSRPGGRVRLPPVKPRWPHHRRRLGREGRLAAHQALRRSGRCSGHCPSRSSPYLREAVPRRWGELEQIQMLLGHASVQTTERYLGTKQDLVHAPNDVIKLRVVV
jgi:integrase